MPCDPVVTVADDVVFFECFSADESSYGCLTREPRGRLRPTSTSCGSARRTSIIRGTLSTISSRCAPIAKRASASIPPGFEVATQRRADYREEKIDLPAGWLRGFMQMQAAMALPMRARHALARGRLLAAGVAQAAQGAQRARARCGSSCCPASRPAGARAVGAAHRLARRAVRRARAASRSASGAASACSSLARLLPLVERVDVYLLGTGLPSFWVAHMGEMRLTLGLSGWTTNDWTRGSALDLLAPPVAASAEQIARVGQQSAARARRDFADLVTRCGMPAPQTAAALNHLAHYRPDNRRSSAGVYRWRQIMPQAPGRSGNRPGESGIGAARGKSLARKRAVVESQVKAPTGGDDVTGQGGHASRWRCCSMPTAASSAANACADIFKKPACAWGRAVTCWRCAGSPCRTPAPRPAPAGAQRWSFRLARKEARELKSI